MIDIRKVKEISLSRLEKAGSVVMTNNSESERGLTGERREVRGKGSKVESK